jgi:hypothetical protein
MSLGVPVAVVTERRLHFMRGPGDVFAGASWSFLNMWIKWQPHSSILLVATVGLELVFRLAKRQNKSKLR